jgi:hypothetical protein
LRDHWWVQRRDEGGWADVDLLVRPRTDSATLTSATETVAVHDVAADLYHEIAIRVVTEQSWRGGRREERILEHVLRPAALVGQPIVLQFWPGSWPSHVSADVDSRYGVKAAALEQTEWAAVLDWTRRRGQGRHQPRRSRRRAGGEPIRWTGRQLLEKRLITARRHPSPN